MADAPVNHDRYSTPQELRHPLGNSAAEVIAVEGFCQVALPSTLQGQYRTAVQVARQFFDLPIEAKELATTSTGDGFREIGREYSVAPDRPDLNESFCVWMHDLEKPLFTGQTEAVALRECLHALLPPLLGVAQTLLGRIAQLHATDGRAARAIDISGATYIQVNRYRPSRNQRDFLQDRHEDGHLVTLQYCPLPGLEIENADGTWTTAPCGTGHLSIMAGELLTLMTGGKTPTAYHRVRRLAGQDDRISIMLFVTPTLRGRLAPWVSADDSHLQIPDVNRLPVDDQRRFGMLDTSALLTAP